MAVSVIDDTEYTIDEGYVAFMSGGISVLGRPGALISLGIDFCSNKFLKKKTIEECCGDLVIDAAFLGYGKMITNYFKVSSAGLSFTAQRIEEEFMLNSVLSGKILSFEAFPMFDRIRNDFNDFSYLLIRSALGAPISIVEVGIRAIKSLLGR